MLESSLVQGSCWLCLSLKALSAPVCSCSDYVQFWAQRGVEVVAWTVNTHVEKEYFENVLCISYITDSLVEDSEPHF